MHSVGVQSLDAKGVGGKVQDNFSLTRSLIKRQAWFGCLSWLDGQIAARPVVAVVCKDAFSETCRVVKC